tara:strand:+ start:14973 stop:15287 length:315 start_codon:yes stop_codon:yes gene_type:complete
MVKYIIHDLDQDIKVVFIPTEFVPATKVFMGIGISGPDLVQLPPRGPVPTIVGGLTVHSRALGGLAHLDDLMILLFMGSTVPEKEYATKGQKQFFHFSKILFSA